MSGVDTSPEALRQMAVQLATMTNSVNTALGRVRSALNGAQWRDQNRTAFDQHMETLTGLARQMEQTAKVAQTLARTKAGQLDQYLGR